MKQVWQKHKTFIIGYVVVLAVALALPMFIDNVFTIHVLILSLIWSIMGIGWNFIGGYAGQISNGHSLYYAIGAYAVAIGSYNFNMTPWVTMWVGMAISVGIAFLLGTPLLRLNGAYFLIATMAVAECARIVALNMPSIGGATGINFLDKNSPELYSLQFSSKEGYYYLFLIFVAVLVILTKVLDRSKFGYYLRAVKANEQSAQSVGINTSKYKLLAYMLSAAIVSLAGSLYAPYVQYIDPYMLMPLNISTMICLVAVMGGVGTVVGPILGAFTLTFISEYFRAAYVRIGGLDMLMYGVLVILIVLFLPGGIISLFRKRDISTRRLQLQKGAK